MEIFKEFGFESAHSLPNVGADHKCSRLHGHSFRVRVTVSGQVGESSGWVMDFADLKARVSPTIDALDHRYLNDIPGLENPTSENLARYIWHEVVTDLDGLIAVEVRETCQSGSIYRGD